MDYAGDPYIDEDGEPLMDPDAAPDSPPHGPSSFHFDDEDDDGAGNYRRDRSPTPVLGSDASGSKPRKRLLRKGSSPDRSAAFGRDDGFDDWDEEETPAALEARRRKVLGSKGHSSAVKSVGKEKRKEREMPGSGGRNSLKGLKGFGSHDADEEREMWDTVAGGDSEDDQDGPRTIDDDNFIDDSGLDPAHRYGSYNDGGSPSRAPQAEEDEDIKQLFKGGKKKKKNEKSQQEIAMIVEHVMAELDVAAEEDAELNRQSKPAINKLRKLPLLIDALSKKNLQMEFLDHGVLTLLKNWLEPLPDGSLPNMNVRSAILKLLTEYPIDLEQYERREMLKKSGLGKVIMFLSRSDEEITANRKIAQELVDKWSRPIFNKSTRFEDMRSYDKERAPYHRPAKKPKPSSIGTESRDEDFDSNPSTHTRKGQASRRQPTIRPEASPMDFVLRPQSKVDPEEVRARAKQVVQDSRRLKMNKKLQQLKAPKKKNLQASKLSVEGRGMVKYL